MIHASTFERGPISSLYRSKCSLLTYFLALYCYVCLMSVSQHVIFIHTLPYDLLYQITSLFHFTTEMLKWERSAVERVSGSAASEPELEGLRGQRVERPGL